MAWQRDEANLGISGATAYSYTEVDWSVNATHAIYRHIGGVTSPYNFGATAMSTLQWWESGTWHDYAGPASHYFSGYGDQPILDVDDSFVRQAADRTVSLGCYTTMMGGGARAWIDYTVPHLAPSVTWASSNPVVRNSDNSITLTWNAPALEYSAMCIEVQTDNSGTWSQEIVLWNTATTTTWTGCSAGHSYQFRIRTNYLSSYSDYDTCATVITNSPLPPDKLTTQATSGTWVDVILENTSPVATSVTYELSADGSTWVAGDTGQPLTGFSVNMGSYHYIRVKNVNSTGSSNWRASGYIKTVTVPNPPTLLSPTSMLNLSTAGGNVTFTWQHNAVDGSAQTEAKLRYSTDGGSTWASTISMSPKTTESYTMAIPWAAGTTITWQVKTKGAATTGGSTNDGFSDWSASSQFLVASEPTATITSPSASVTGMPFSIAATYSDMTGYTCQAATVTLKQSDRTILTKPATINGTAITASIGIDEALLDNGASYTVVLGVRSSSGLQSSSNVTFITAFTEPVAGQLAISNDPDTGYASIMATFSQSSEESYGGATNVQFDTTEGYIKSLKVNGKADIIGGTLSSIASVGIQSNGTTTTIMTALRSAGSANDELQVNQTAVKVARKVGSVDLGTLAWTATTLGGNSVFSTYNLTSVIKPASANSQIANIICEKFTPVSRTMLNSVQTSPSMAVNTAGHFIAVPVTAYADATTFKTAMSGVYLFYELATEAEDVLPDISLMELGTTATITTEINSTFTMTGWDGYADPVSVSVARVNADGLTPLITDGSSGAGAVDKYAPLNKRYQYAVTTKSSANAVKTVYVDNEIVTDLWFAYWGENIASAKWNPDNGGIQVTRPHKTRVYYAGRKDPVSYDGAAVSWSETPSWMLVDRDEKQPFIQLIEDGGRGVYKSCDGDVYHADFELTLSPKYIAIGYYGVVMLSVTRIAGDQL